MLVHVVISALSFVGVWIGSGVAIKAVERLSKLLRISSFFVSFFILGFFTSISELSVGINSLFQNDPEIYVGNLVGASIVLLMCIVPLLAIVGRSIRISSEFQGFHLPAALVVVALPVILALDGRIGRVDTIISLLSFGLLVISIQSKKNILKHLQRLDVRSGASAGRELLSIVFGVVTIFIASRFIVEQTLYFSRLLHVSPFLISLLLIAFGTNIPELSLVVRAMFMKSNQVAFGDYMGSAVFNTFLLGILNFMYGKPVLLTNSYLTSLLFLIIGIILFYFFARTKHAISKQEGAVLLGLYCAFVLIEVVLHSRT